MALRENEPQVRKHYWLYKSDVEEIKALFGSTVGESKAVRLMVRKCLQQIKAKALERQGGLPTAAPANADLGAEIDAMMEEAE